MPMSALYKFPSDIFIARWLPRAVEVAIVLFAAWIVAGWLTGSDSFPPAKKFQVHPSSTRVAEVSAIIAVPLFGEQVAGPTSSKPVSMPVAAAPTQLNVRLLGTVMAGRRSSAVMKVGSGKEKVIFLGGDIQPGLVLKQVEAGAIVVSNHGRMERVLMARGKPLTSAVDNTLAAPEQHQFTRTAIQAQMRNLPKLLTGVLAVPHQMNGVPDGFLLQDIVPGSLYAQAGLQNGDVVNKVNGQDVTTQEQGIALFKSLQNAQSIDLEITRTGARQRLHFDIH